LGEEKIVIGEKILLYPPVKSIGDAKSRNTVEDWALLFEVRDGKRYENEKENHVQPQWLCLNYAKKKKKKHQRTGGNLRSITSAPGEWTIPLGTEMSSPGNEGLTEGGFGRNLLPLEKRKREQSQELPKKNQNKRGPVFLMETSNQKKERRRNPLEN